MTDYRRRPPEGTKRHYSVSGYPAAQMLVGASVIEARDARVFERVLKVMEESPGREHCDDNRMDSHEWIANHR